MVRESEVIDEALKNHPFRVVEKFIQEVHWRTYWKGWLEHRPQVWSHYKSARERLKNSLDEADRKKSNAIMRSESGNSLVDAWSHELVTTGYLHNHVRMWFASYWIHGCRLPWELGAEFFENHLLDADAASNTLSWRWVAGLQTKGKTYLFSAANVARYDWRAALPEHRRALQDFDGMTPCISTDWQAVDADNTALPVGGSNVDFGEVKCVLIHEENVGLTDDFLSQCRPELVVVSLWKDDDTSPVRKKWRQAVTEDTLRRLGDLWGCDILRWRRSIDDEWIVKELLKRKMNRVDCVRPATGPLRDDLETFLQRLRESHIILLEHADSWDANYWPLAKKGFFPYWDEVRKKYLTTAHDK